jgi:hypothetical protein
MLVSILGNVDKEILLITCLDSSYAANSINIIALGTSISIHYFLLLFDNTMIETINKITKKRNRKQGYQTDGYRVVKDKTHRNKYNKNIYYHIVEQNIFP